MPHIVFVVALVVVSVAFAQLEIEIEGNSGWASALPTWKLENRWTRALLGARPLTGYHVWAHVFVLLVLHLPYGLALAPPSWAFELRILSFLILFWIVEDFLWFVLNPAFGIRRFTRAHATWHSHSWWGFMPREYWIFLPIGIAFYVASVSS